MSGARPITGFAFDLSCTDGSTRRGVQVLGSGGLIGDGMLSVINGPRGKLTASKAERKALMMARRSIVHDPEVLVLRSWELPPEERFEKVAVREVLACRVIGGAP